MPDLAISTLEARRSTVLVGAATKKGTWAASAAKASGYVPTLFAVSPLQAIRSAPTTTQPILPLESNEAAAASGSNVTGMPSCRSSQAVSLAPCSQGRVSSANTAHFFPASSAARTRRHINVCNPAMPVQSQA